MPTFPELEPRTKAIGGANVAFTLSSLPVTLEKRTRLVAVYITYSAAVSVSATVTLNSGIGSDYDVTLATLVFTAERYGVYLSERPIPISEGDVIDVLAPAGGASVTAAIEIKFEHDYPEELEKGYQVEFQRPG